MTCTFIRQTPFSHQPLFKVSLKGDSLTQVLLYIFSLKCRCCRNIIKQLLKEKLKLPPTTMNVFFYDKNVCHMWITPSWISKNNYQNRTEQNFNYRVKFSGHEWWHERTYSITHVLWRQNMLRHVWLTVFHVRSCSIPIRRVPFYV